MCYASPAASRVDNVQRFFSFFKTLLPGYEMYTTMRADPCLCFLERVGRPDDKAIDAEQHTGDAELGDE